MSVPKHWLLGGWYPRGLIVHQQRYRSIMKHKYQIKCAQRAYGKTVNTWIYVFESWSLTSNIITLSQLYHKLIIAQCFIYAQWKYVVLIPIVLKTYCTDMLHCTITCLNLWLHIRDHILTHAYYTHKKSIRVHFITFKH